MNWIRFILAFILFELVSCKEEPSFKTEFEGRTLPNFNLLLADSSTHFNSRSIPTDQCIVLFYFSPYCPFCRAEMAEIINHIETLKAIRFYVFTPWSFIEMKAFYNHFHLEKYENITVGVDSCNSFGQYFQLKGVPYTAVYGKNKKLISAAYGKIDSDRIREIAEK